MDEHSGPDCLVVHHTHGLIGGGAALEDQPQPYPSRSTGVRGSSTRAEFVGFAVTNGGIAGLRVDWLSPAVGQGDAVLAAASADSVTFTAPGDSAGAEVPIGIGVTRICASADASRYALVTRTGPEDLAGTCALHTRYTYNNALTGGNLSAAETTLARYSGTVDFVGVTGTFTFDTVYALPTPLSQYEGWTLHWTGGDYAGMDSYWKRFHAGALNLLQPLDPFPSVGDTLDLLPPSGRLHCLSLRAYEDAVRDLEIWLPPLGTEQSITVGYPTNGLAVSGGGTFNLPDVSDWHPAVRFLRILDSSGSEKEIVGGYLDGAQFIVSARARGLHGTLPAATTAGDIVIPHSGARIAFDGNGLQDPATAGLNSGTPDPLGASAYALETVAPVSTTGLAYLPGVQAPGWTAANDEGFGLTLGIIPFDYRIGLWIHLEAFPGIRHTGQTPVHLAWKYTVDDVEYHQTARSWYRIANDLAAERYRVYNAVDDGAETLIGTAAARPIADVSGLVDNAVNRISVRKVNDYGIEATIGEARIELNAGSEYAAPAAPDGLTVRQTASGALLISAFYYPPADAAPADQWEIEIPAVGLADTYNETLTRLGDQLAELARTVTDTDYDVAGLEILVRVRMVRTSDGATSAWATATVTMAAASLDAATGGLFHDDRKLTQESG